MRHKFILCCVSIAIMLGCTAQSKEGDPELPAYIRETENVVLYPYNPPAKKKISFSKEKSFPSEEILIGRIGEIAVNEYGGVYISDQIPGAPAIHSFSQSGEYLGEIGREGEGPGEYRHVGGMKINADNLVVYDGPSARFTFFSLHTGNVDRVVQISPEMTSKIDQLRNTFHFPRSFFVSDNGELLTGFSSFQRDTQAIQYYKVDLENNIYPDKILSVNDEEIHVEYSTGAMILPVSRIGLIDVSPSGNIYSTSTEDFVIFVHNQNGTYQRAFYYPIDKQELNRVQFLRQYENHPAHHAIRDKTLPETWPALNDLLVDDENRLWVSAIVENFDIYEWWVLEETGELIARFEWPRNEPIEVVKNGYMYTRETDSETGLQQIVRYGVGLEEV